MYSHGFRVRYHDFFRRETFRNIISFLEYDFRVPAGTRGLFPRARAKSGQARFKNFGLGHPKNLEKTARAGSGSGRAQARSAPNVYIYDKKFIKNDIND